MRMREEDCEAVFHMFGCAHLNACVECEEVEKMGIAKWRSGDGV